MINVATASMLSQYRRWADQVFFDSLATLPAEELGKERAGPLKSMIATLNHVHVVDRIWQAHLQRREHGFKTRMEVPYPELADLRRAQEEINDWLIAWSAQQTDESLNELITFTFVSGAHSAMTAGAMLLHVVNHANYHRGWVVQMCFESSAKPPMTDLSVFLTEVRHESTTSC